MKRVSILLFLLAASSAFLFNSCNDDLGFGTANLQFKIMANGGDMAYNTDYTFEGNTANFQTVQFYVSGIRFVNEDGQEVLMDDYLLVKPDGVNYQLGDLIAGKYDKIKFDVGIDQDVNHADPSLYVVGSVLGPQSPAMHWSWMMGYIFIRFDGQVDSAGTDIDLEMHLGTDNFLRTIELDFPFELKDEGDISAVVELDVDKVLKGIDITTDHVTHTGDNISLATSVIANVPGAFSIGD